MQFPVGQNPRAQTAAAFQKFFRTRRNGAIHPITRSAFASPVKSHALHFEFAADQFVKIDIARYYVASHQGRRAILQLACAAKFLKNFSGEKSNLPFVIVSIIEKAVAANSVAGDAFDHRYFHGRIFIRFAAVMTEKIVAL